MTLYRNHTSGFTLIELMMVVAIIGTLARSQFLSIRTTRRGHVGPTIFRELDR